MTKIALAVVSALFALALTACSEPQDLNGAWVQDEGFPTERVLTINEQDGTWSIAYANSPAANVDGTLEAYENAWHFMLNNEVFLEEGHRTANTRPEVARTGNRANAADPETLKLDIEDDRGYPLNGTWRKRG